jgi:hypothetical protein
MKFASRNPNVDSPLIDAASVAEVVALAWNEGFDFTAKEFTAVMQEFLQKEIREDQALEEFRHIRLTTGAEQLGRKMVEHFIGGVVRRYDLWPLWLARPSC